MSQLFGWFSDIRIIWKISFIDQGPGIRDQGPGTRDQGSGTRDQGPETEFNKLKRSLTYYQPVQILNHGFKSSWIFTLNRWFKVIGSWRSSSNLVNWSQINFIHLRYPIIVIPCRYTVSWGINHLSSKVPTLDIQIKRSI